MNDSDQDQFEADLRNLAPARPPAALMSKLAAARPQSEDVPAGLGLQRSSGAFRWGPGSPKRQRAGTLQNAGAHARVAPRPQPSTINYQPVWRLLRRWLAPAAALGVMLALLVWLVWQERRQHGRLAAAGDKPALKADKVELDQQLVGMFDAVARLPDGQPVRFRCREWADEVVLSDSARGIVVEQRTPRLEVVPVSIETY